MDTHFRIVRGKLRGGASMQAQAAEFIAATIIPALQSYPQLAGIDFMVNEEAFALETKWIVPAGYPCPIGDEEAIEQVFVDLHNQASEMVESIEGLEYYTLAFQWTGPVGG